MEQSTIERLHDALMACDEIAFLIEGLTEESYLRSRAPRFGVNWQVVVLGESLNVALTEADELNDQIPAARSAIATRHRIAHGYQTIDYRLMWHISTVHVPMIRDQVATVLESIGHLY